MKSTTKIKLGLIILCAIASTLITLNPNPVISQNTNNETIKTSGAGKSMDVWSLERSYPYETISTSKYLDAFEEKRISHEQRSSLNTGQWESLGPQNIGGRTLCLAFHPTNPDIIFAGSASGGLWKTTTQGVGINAWEYIETGFPVLGVASIAIDPNNADIIFIGTGEVYGSGFAQPGTEHRLTRGTYGIGILKSVDAGNTWSHELVFNENELKGVSDIEINPTDTSIIFAATSNGIYRTTNSGDSWSLVLNQPDCIDIEIDPNNTNTIYVSQGNFNTNLSPNLSGLFKSTNGGDSFTELLDSGLLTAWSGNAKLSIDPTNSNTIYASIQVGFFNTAATTPAGIYKSINGGINWTKINNQNIAQFQGWYSHDIAINPNNPSEIINVGIDAWKSTDTGANFIKKSDWTTWEFGVISIDTPEGGDNYIHGDIHAVYYHPLVANKVFFASDGGVFSSADSGETFATNNGGLKTTQFYANMASSTTDPNFIIAGAQDNATYIYRGTPSWERTLGGDGMSASIRPDNDQIVFGSAQGLNMFRSTDGGTSFPTNVKPTLLANDYTTFSAPYEIAPSNNDIIYAGSTGIYRSIDNASSWTPVSFGAIDGSNAVAKIAVSPTNADVIYVSTAVIPLVGLTGTAKILKSINGGQSFTTLSGLPDRIAKDIEFDPNNENIIYLTFSGFGSNHVYKTINGGDLWTAIDNGLPDLPTNTVLIDPSNSDHIYVGNDLGVYFSENGGNTWEVFSEGLPEAVMIYDLNLSTANNKVRIATHGHGIYQRDLASSLSVESFDIATSDLEIYPNPSNQSDALHIRIDSKKTLEKIQIVLYNALGQKVNTVYDGSISIGQNEISWNIAKSIAAGNYFITMQNGKQRISKQVIIN